MKSFQSFKFAGFDRCARLWIAVAALRGILAAGQTLPNPSFEINTFSVAPGFVSDNGPITGWTANPDTGAGLNPAGGSSQFADNGAIPEGKNVAFLQAGSATLSTTISGLTIGKTYKVMFQANATTNQVPVLRVSIGDQELLAVAVYSVGGTKPYGYLAFEFTATAATQTMTLMNDAAADNTLLLDNFTIAPSSGRWTVAAWNGDEDSGINANYVYTHAYNFGSASPTINSILFNGVAGSNPSVANRFTTTYLGNVFTSDANNLTGDSKILATDFVYGGTVPAGSFQSITLMGLTPGTEYVATVYSVGFDGPGPTIRWATFSVGEDRLTVNQDQFDNNNGILIAYRYVADAGGTVTLKYAPVNPSNVSIHTYGFSNREAQSRNVPPVIAAQPQNTTVAEGQPATFVVSASGIPAPTYQWRFKGGNLGGATTALNTLPAVTPANAGNYDVIVKNSMGSVTSIVATLTVGLRMNNPSFETDAFGTYPGYVTDNGPITDWTSPNGDGVNPVVDGSSPFADNGTIPHGKQVAFMQADGALSQTVSGFTVNGQYYLHYYENSRTTVTPSVEVKLGGNTLIAQHAVPAVGGANPYHEVYSDMFTATATALELAFVKSNPLNGDSTALIDNVAFVQVPAGTSPFITRAPQALIVSVGNTATLSAQALGSLPLSFQWLKNGAEIAGATGASFTLNNLQKTDEGDYAVRITNSSGNATSATAHVTVYEPIPDLFNTGVDDNRTALADGAVDPHYRLIANADTNSPNAFVEDSTVFPISDGTWLRDTAISKWIGPQFNTVASAVGFYTYRTQIVLKDRDPSTLIILGQWSTDNAGRDIQVNGVSTGNRENPGFNVYTPFAIYGTNVNFVAGTNTIDFIVENIQDPGYTGLRVEILASNLRIPAGVAPEFTTQPLSQTAVEGDNVTLVAAAKGTSPLAYQWKKDGVALSGQTGLTLTITKLTTADSGAYTVTASNSAGTATSNPADLCVCLRTIPGVYGTGVNAQGALLPAGAADPHYVLTVSAEPNNPGPEAIVVNSTWPVAPDGPWVANGPVSKWISAQADQATGSAEGDYVFETTFDLTGYDLSQVQVVGAWSVDNTGTDIVVNGTSTGLKNNAGFAGFIPFTLTAANGLVAGKNTLDFLLNNAPATPNPTALRVDLRALIPIPGKPTLTIRTSGTNVVISWSPAMAGQKLQSAPNVTGPWNTIANASNPYTASAAGASTFFRVEQ